MQYWNDHNNYEFELVTLTFPKQIVVPVLPGKALKRMLPFRGDDGEFSFILIQVSHMCINYMISENCYVYY